MKTDGKKTNTTHRTILAKLVGQHFADTFVVNQSLVLSINVYGFSLTFIGLLTSI